MKGVATAVPFKKSPSSEWTRERLANLSKQELTNLQANALRLGEARCSALRETNEPQRDDALRFDSQPHGVTRDGKPGIEHRSFSRPAAFFNSPKGGKFTRSVGRLVLPPLPPRGTTAPPAAFLY